MEEIKRIEEFSAHGKLLIFGEYVVLDACQALSWPTRFGQTLKVVSSSSETFGVEWISVDWTGKRWFKAYMDEYFVSAATSDLIISDRLEALMKGIRQLKPELDDDKNLESLEVQSNYPLEWGLGSSATLVSLLAQWAGVDPMELFFLTQKGSGYDVATASSEGPILYTLQSEKNYKVEPIQLSVQDYPGLCFLFLGNKQSSAEGINHYQKTVSNRKELAQEMNTMLQAFYANPTRALLMETMRKSEELLSKHLNLKKVKDKYFPDFPGEIKSLGAWGGDFVMVLPDDPQFDSVQYFVSKGYVPPYQAEEILL